MSKDKNIEALSGIESQDRLSDDGRWADDDDVDVDDGSFTEVASSRALTCMSDDSVGLNKYIVCFRELRKYHFWR